MRIALGIAGILLISYGLLRYEGSHRYMSYFFDELWIKLDDGVLKKQRTFLTWIDKTKLISLRIIDIFFERKTFSWRNFISSWLFIKIALSFNLALLYITCFIRYASPDKTFKLIYVQSYFIPFFDEITISPLILSIDGLSARHVIIFAMMLLLVTVLLLLIRFFVHNFSIVIGSAMVTALIVSEVCYKWNKIGSLIIDHNVSGDILEKHFTQYSSGIKIIIYAIDVIALPLILMALIYILRRILKTKRTCHYIMRILIVTIVGYFLFCYIVLLNFWAHIQHWQWSVGWSAFLPNIFIPIATLSIMILLVIAIVTVLLFLLFLADRIVYIIPKYKILEQDKYFIYAGAILILISRLKIISIKEIIKLFVDKLL